MGTRSGGGEPCVYIVAQQPEIKFRFPLLSPYSSTPAHESSGKRVRERCISQVAGLVPLSLATARGWSLRMACIADCLASELL